MVKVYLAGGMREPWREPIKALSNKVIWFDPCENDTEDPEEYTNWDLADIEECDILFGYFEKTNPSGLGLMLEIGYALGLRKRVILVDEKGDKYAEMARRAVRVFRTQLPDGIEELKHYLNLKEDE